MLLVQRPEKKKRIVIVIIDNVDTTSASALPCERHQHQDGLLVCWDCEVRGMPAMLSIIRTEQSSSELILSTLLRLEPVSAIMFTGM